ncbi:hypothetical protein FRC04_005559 [Tulasnella sp. 424]|nr:hypothetical protein FRC04_005559 [Tulasnella sp. 424]KAG8961135.1 hypothetical protein FRC05_006368 [Tulasnella sp. 425]
MPLDENLFTLKIRRSEEEPGALDLVDPKGQLYYRKRFIPPQKVGDAPTTPLYDLWDPLSDSLLATMAANKETLSKRRAIQLYNPPAEVELSFTGTINFRWQFPWEEHTFEFKREECFLLRKPDPPVLVAVYEFDKKQNKPEVGLVQLLDYNLTRFDVEDRKGLEIVILTGLLSFQDAITGQPDNAGGPAPEATMLTRVTTFGAGAAGSPPVPQLPPKDVGMQVSGLQIREKAAPNEVIVTNMFEVEEYAQYAANLLKDDKMLFIVVRSKTALEVPKVVAVASLVKRLRYKGGAHDEELHQYAKYEEAAEKKGPRVINLDGPAKEPPKEYKPPTALSIHLSKIPMPELQAKAPPPERSTTSNVPRPGLQVPSGSSSGRNDRPGRRTHSAEPRPSARPGPGAGRHDRPASGAGWDDRPSPGSRSDERPSPTSDRPDRPAVLTKKQQKEQAKEEERRRKEQERIRKEMEKESRSGKVPSAPALQSTSQPGGPAYPGGYHPPGRRPSPPSVNMGGRPPQQAPTGPQDGPQSPRTSFWGFYSPGTLANEPSPSHRQQPPAHPPKPPGYGGRPSPVPAQSSGQNMPGSYFPSNPPPPPPALQAHPQQPQPQQGGSHGGLSSILGNQAMPSSASQAVKMAGNIGMQLFDKYTKK